jgi:hypothetical protein
MSPSATRSSKASLVHPLFLLRGASHASIVVVQSGGHDGLVTGELEPGPEVRWAAQGTVTGRRAIHANSSWNPARRSLSRIINGAGRR